MNQKILLLLPWLLLATLSPAFSFAATEPSAAPAPSVTGPLATNYFDLEVNYTKPADAAGVLVVARQAYTPVTAPADTTVYTANARLGVGDTIVAGCILYCDYVVADDTASGSVTVTGLKDGTKYYFAAYSYNGTGTDIDYNRTITPVSATTASVPVAGRSHNEMWVADSSPKDGVNWGTMTSADCAKCHGVHHTSQLLPSGQDQFNKCQSCHRAGGPAAAKTDIGLHPADGSVDCGTCHSMHSFRKEELYSTDHAGVKGFNKSFVRANMSKYVNPTDYPPPGGGGSITGLDNTVFQNRPAHFAFASADPVSGKFNGPCQSCHKDPDVKHHTQTGTDGHQIGQDCIVCHKHSDKFLHGGGSGTGCDDCHGHDAGYDGNPDHGGAGSYYTHSVHTENDDSDELKGPNIGCSVCHNISSFPDFADGVSYWDYKAGTAMTTVCNNCHSPGGDYDGVNDSVIGAKNNWSALGSSDSRVYNVDGSFKSNKEKWCAGCHDNGAPANGGGSTISGIAAPNVIGDEGGTYTYGTGWGYYKTGHGLPSTGSYPASGGQSAGAGVECDGCHDFSTTHIDGLARTFDDNENSELDPSYYRIGYRLKIVAAGQGTGGTGREPLRVPFPSSAGIGANNFRLCLNCHTSTPFLDDENFDTNFRTDAPLNLHEYHTRYTGFGYRASADWSNTDCTSSTVGGPCTSRITCMTCHNVHGSPRLAMVRGGELIGRGSGLKIWYYSPSIEPLNSPPNTWPPIDDLPLTASTGWVWAPGSAMNLCSVCHGGSQWLAALQRTTYLPVPQSPTLAWIEGETNGVSPDSGAGGGNFTFRVTYADGNDDAPTVRQLWIDRNDDGDYDDLNEHQDMNELDSFDTSYFNGKVYTFSTTLAKSTDGNLKYCFHFMAGVDPASGEPDCSHDHQVAVANNPPVLSWLGLSEPNFTNDGVNPDFGVDGASFEFRVKYTDGDGECPPTAADIQVWIDKNDDGDYLDSGEKVNMTALDANSCASGRVYSFSTALAFAGNGELTYTFRASDGHAQAGAESGPLSDNLVTIGSSANTPPVLAWATADCLTEGVRPRTGAKDADFEFRVKYSDADNQCPSIIQVTVNGTAYELTSNDGAPCQTGRIYYRTMAISTAGDLNYSFSASDGVDPATGEPVASHVVSVINTPYVVRPSGGTYNSIQTAVNNSADPSTILVYPNSDFSAATYAGFILSTKNNRTIQAVCGADLTIVSGGTDVVSSTNSNYWVLDGFDITGGSSRGLYLSCNASQNFTLKNSRIHDNTGQGVYLAFSCRADIQNTDIYSNGGGIYLANNTSRLTLADSEIYANSAANGAGIYITGSTLTTHTITNTSIRDNTASSNGGGIYCNACKLDIQDSHIDNNDATSSSGGGIFCVWGCYPTIDDSTINGNTATAGGAFYSSNNTTNVNITDTFIQGNEATSGPGGAFDISNGGSVTMTNAMLTGNKATGSGGAIYHNYGYTNCTFCTISGNYSGAKGGGIYVNNTNETSNLKNSIVYNNDAAAPTDGSYRQIETNLKWSFMDVYNTLINQPPGSGSGNPRYSYEDLGGNLTGSNPNFETPIANPSTDTPTTAGDFRIQSGSPAVNAASSSFTSDHDIFGGDRPLPPAGGYDMGAHEKE